MKKKLTIVLIVILLLILLVPVPIYLKDGGTVVYQAVLYKVSRVPSLDKDIHASEHKISSFSTVYALVKRGYTG